LFQTHAKGSEPITYQWLKDGAIVAGETNSVLVLSEVRLSDQASYTVVASNDSGSVTSHPPAYLFVNAAVNPVITSQPRSDTLFVGAKSALRATVTGSPPLTFQWWKDGSAVPGAAQSTLPFASVQFPDAGEYLLVASNSHGSVTSAPARLNVVARTLHFPAPGTVVNLSGALLPPDLTNIIAIAAGQRHALALRDDETIAMWRNGYPHLESDFFLDPLTNVVGIAAGWDRSYAVLADGTVVRSGPNGGPLPNVDGVVGIAAGSTAALAVRSDGRVVNMAGVDLQPGLSNVIDIATDGNFHLALKRDGTLAAFGIFPPDYVLTTPADVTAVAVGSGFLAVKSDGSVVNFGPGAIGVPEGLGDVVAVSAGYGRNLALKADGTVVGWGRLAAPPRLTNVSAISAGGLYSLVLTTNPPIPIVAGRMAGGGFELSAPVSVSGYALEATDDLSKPYEVIAILPDSTEPPDLENPALKLSTADPKRFYRLRKL
jgi:alpha-tubulin suppressor-like RCC1 family protein